MLDPPDFTQGVLVIIGVGYQDRQDLTGVEPVGLII